MTLLLRLALLALLALAVFLAAADSLWLAELAQHFRAHLALLALAGLLAALLLRRYREAAAALLVAVLLGGPAADTALPRGWQWPVIGATAQSAPTPGAASPGGRLTLVAANLLHTNSQPEHMVDALLATGADVLVLSEVSRSWQAVNRRLLEHYPHRTPELWWRSTSTVVWSRHPLRQGEAKLRHLAGGYVLDVTLEVEGAPLRLFALHPPRPIDPPTMRRRNAIFGQLEDWVAERDLPTVLAGDFNATPWTPALRRLIEGAGLERARPRRGWYASWPARLGDLGIPIDHVLHGGGGTVEEVAILEIPGSDHRAVTIALALP